MNIKSLAKNILSPSMYDIGKYAYQVFQSTAYWVPYILMNGKAWSPRNLTFEITYRCNLKCMMCPLYNELKKSKRLKLSHSIDNNKELSIDEIKLFLKSALSAGIKNLTITGGEPFLRDDLCSIIRHAKTLNLITTIISNGTLINEDIANDIVNSGLDYIVFSIDGPRDIHDTIRNSKGSFEKTIKAIDLITQIKHIAGSMCPYISINCTISSLNTGRLSEILFIAKSFKVPITYQYLYYTTKEMEEQTKSFCIMGSAKYEDQDIDDSMKKIDCITLQKEIEQISNYAKDNNLEIRFQPPLKGDEIYRRFYDDSYAYTSKCFLPWIALRVNPFGEVYPCSMAINMGNVRKDNLNIIWNGEKYVKFRKALKKHKLFPKCYKCCALCDKLWSYLPG